jgi:hypothetical protein
MKKKIFGALVVVVIAVGAMINVNLNKVSNKGDLAMANVEALAQLEGGDENPNLIKCTEYMTNTMELWGKCEHSNQTVLLYQMFVYECNSGNTSTCRRGSQTFKIGCDGSWTMYQDNLMTLNCETLRFV